MRSCAYRVHALLLFVKVQVELSPLPNFGMKEYGCCPKFGRGDI
jgi:hypothetical protein